MDTGNKATPDNCTHAAVRDMPSHCRVLVGLIASGTWAQQPMETLDEKVTEAKVAAFLPFSTEVVKRLEQEEREMNVGELAGKKGESRDQVAVESRGLGYEAVRCMCTNLASVSQTMYDCTLPGLQPFSNAIARAWADLLISTTTSNWWNRKNGPEQRLNFLLFVVQSLDGLHARLAEAGQRFETYEAIEAADIANVERSKYEDATMAAVEDLSNARKWVRRNVPCAISPSLKISSDLKQPPPKKQRGNG